MSQRVCGLDAGNGGKGGRHRCQLLLDGLRRCGWPTIGAQIVKNEFREQRVHLGQAKESEWARKEDRYFIGIVFYKCLNILCQRHVLDKQLCERLQGGSQ